MRDNRGVVIHTVPELFLASVASRSSLVGALLRTAHPANRTPIADFLKGLSRDELQCIAEFQGSCIIESEISVVNEYRVMADFFESDDHGRWPDPGDRAHKTFIVLAWLDMRKSPAPATISFALS
jgi:hypothetical protein